MISKFLKTQLVELPIVAASTASRFYFPTQNFLRAKRIMSIQTFTVTDIPTSPQGNALVPTANFKVAYLTLYGENPEPKDADGLPSTGAGEWISRLPLIALHNISNGTDPFVYDLAEFVPRNIVWEKSYVDVIGGLGGASPALSFLFEVGYQGNGGDN